MHPFACCLMSLYHEQLVLHVALSVCWKGGNFHESAIFMVDVLLMGGLWKDIV